MNPTETRAKAAKGPSAINAQMPPSTATLTDSASNSDMVVFSPVELLSYEHDFPHRNAFLFGYLDHVSRMQASVRLIFDLDGKLKPSTFRVRSGPFFALDDRLDRLIANTPSRG